jgi:ubiquinone/menaquinone biosynthesis C-methylase UbiE
MSDLSKRGFFDKEARGWNDRYHQDDQSEIRRLMERFDIRPGDRILDVGTGNGVLLPHLLGRAKDTGEIVALDFSWNMIFEAAKIGGTEKILFVNASVENLPVKDQSIDCVTCLATFPHVSGKREAISEVARVLKTDGRLYITHLMGKEELAEHHRLAGEPVQDDTLPPDSEMIEMLKDSGLKDVEIIDRPGLYLASARK